MKPKKPGINIVNTDDELENKSILKSIKVGRKTPKVAESEVSKVLKTDKIRINNSH